MFRAKSKESQRVKEIRMEEYKEALKNKLSEAIRARDFATIKRAFLESGTELLEAFPEVAQAGIELLIDHLEHAYQAVDSIEESLDRSR